MLSLVVEAICCMKTCSSTKFSLLTTRTAGKTATKTVSRAALSFAASLVLWITCSISVAQPDLEMSVWKSEHTDGCFETMTFLSDKEYLMESGDQLITKAYKLNTYRNTDFYVFFQRTTSNNEVANCYGSKGRSVGTRIKVFARFNEANTIMTLYSEPDENEALDVVFLKQGVPQEPSQEVDNIADLSPELDVVETAEAPLSGQDLPSDDSETQ